MKSYPISQGAVLHHIDDPKFKTVTILFAIHRPLNREDAAKNALLPMVLKRGCKKYPTLSDIEVRLQELYGAELQVGVTKKGENQILTFGIQTIQDRFTPDRSEALPLVTELLLSVLLDPVCQNGVFLDEYVEQEKTNLLDMIDALLNDKRRYARFRCIQEMCNDEPFGVHEYGDKESAKKIDAKGLYEYYKTLLATSRLDIFLCGTADAQKILAQVKEALSGKFEAPVPYTQSKIYPRVGDVSYVTEVLDVNQAKLELGLRTNTAPASERYYHLAVANSILGSGVHSKLFNNVREKLSLAYYASSVMVRHKGLMLIGMGIDQDKYEEALKETLLQIQRLKDGDVSSYEFESSKAFLTGLAQAAKDDQYALIDFHLSSLAAGIDEGLDEYTEKILKTTLVQAIEAAKGIELDTVYFLKGRDLK